jgi:hypothetical protein
LEAGEKGELQYFLRVFCLLLRMRSPSRRDILLIAAHGFAAVRHMPPRSVVVTAKESPGSGAGASISRVRSSYIFFEHLLVLASHMPPAFSQSA